MRRNGFERAVAVSLAGALAMMSPGPGSYQAAAQTAQNFQAASGAAGVAAGHAATSIAPVAVVGNIAFLNSAFQTQTCLAGGFTHVFPLPKGERMKVRGNFRFSPSPRPLPQAGEGAPLSAARSIDRIGQAAAGWGRGNREAQSASVAAAYEGAKPKRTVAAVEMGPSFIYADGQPGIAWTRDLRYHSGTIQGVHESGPPAGTPPKNGGPRGTSATIGALGLAAAVIGTGILVFLKAAPGLFAYLWIVPAAALFSHLYFRAVPSSPKIFAAAGLTGAALLFAACVLEHGIGGPLLPTVSAALFGIFLAGGEKTDKRGRVWRYLAGSAVSGVALGAFAHFVLNPGHLAVLLIPAATLSSDLLYFGLKKIKKDAAIKRLLPVSGLAAAAASVLLPAGSWLPAFFLAVILGFLTASKSSLKFLGAGFALGAAWPLLVLGGASLPNAVYTTLLAALSAFWAYAPPLHQPGTPGPKS